MASSVRIAAMLATLAALAIVFLALLYTSFEVVGPALGQVTHPLVGIGLAYVLFLLVWNTAINLLSGQPPINDLVRSLVLGLALFVLLAMISIFGEPALSTVMAKEWALACNLVVASTLFGVAWSVKLPLAETELSALVRSGLVGLMAGLGISFFWVLN